MTYWVKAGAVCECIDQEWVDYFAGEEVTGPMVGERCVVASHAVIDGVIFIHLMGDKMCYEARAFRPIFDSLDDVEMFKSLIKDSSASVPSLESACSR